MTTYQVTRTPAPTDGSAPPPHGTTPISGRVKVIGVRLAPFPDSHQGGTGVATHMETALTDRLRELFGRIEQSTGRISIVWVHNIQAAQRACGRRDVVVYFAPTFTGGLIHDFASRMELAARGAMQRSYTNILDRYAPTRTRPAVAPRRTERSGAGAHNVGLTLPNLDPPWMLTEVYVDSVCNHSPPWTSPGNSNHQGAARAVGSDLAGVAFHEIMHNKVEPAEEADTANWDLHRDGGGAMANMNGYTSQPSEANLNFMAEHLSSTRNPQQVPTHGRQVDIPPAVEQERQRRDAEEASRQQQEQQRRADLSDLDGPLEF